MLKTADHAAWRCIATEIESRQAKASLPMCSPFTRTLSRTTGSRLAHDPSPQLGRPRRPTPRSGLVELSFVFRGVVAALPADVDGNPLQHDWRHLSCQPTRGTELYPLAAPPCTTPDGDLPPGFAEIVAACRLGNVAPWHGSHRRVANDDAIEADSDRESRRSPHAHHPRTVKPELLDLLATDRLVDMTPSRCARRRATASACSAMALARGAR